MGLGGGGGGVRSLGLCHSLARSPNLVLLRPYESLVLTQGFAGGQLNRLHGQFGQSPEHLGLDQLVETARPNHAAVGAVRRVREQRLADVRRLAGDTAAEDPFAPVVVGPQGLLVTGAPNEALNQGFTSPRRGDLGCPIRSQPDLDLRPSLEGNVPGMMVTNGHAVTGSWTLTFLCPLLSSPCESSTAVVP